MNSTYRQSLQKPRFYKYGFHNPETSVFKTPKGLNRKIVESISYYKNEPAWMREFRVRSLEIFRKKTMPTWGADVSDIHFDDLYYYINPFEKKVNTWEQVPKDIRDTYEKIGIPQAEQKFLAGVGAQYDSEVIYNSLKAQWEKQGVVFTDTDTALLKYPDMFRHYFGTIVPPGDNKFFALTTPVWTEGILISWLANVTVLLHL